MLHTLLYVFVHTSTNPTYLGTHHISYYPPLHTLYALVQITTHIICLGTHHYTPYLAWWYTPLHTLHFFVQHPTFLGGKHHDTPFMLLHTSTHLVCLGIHHYTPYMPWYTLLHTFYVFVQCTHHYTPFMSLYTPYTSWYILVAIPHALVHTATHHMPWYTLLHTLHVLIAQCATPLSSLHCDCANSTLKKALYTVFLKLIKFYYTCKVKTYSVYSMCTIIYSHKITSFYDA